MSSLARIHLPIESDDELTGIWAAVPGLGDAVSNLAKHVYDYGNSTLTARERECARMRVAQLNDCPICLGWRIPGLAQQGVTEDMYANVREYRDSSLYSPREKMAIEYVERFMLDHHAMGDDFWRRMRAVFSDKEIFTLGIAVGHLVAFGRLTSILRIGQSACAVPLAANG